MELTVISQAIEIQGRRDKSHGSMSSSWRAALQLLLSLLNWRGHQPKLQAPPATCGVVQVRYVPITCHLLVFSGAITPKLFKVMMGGGKKTRDLIHLLGSANC